MIEAEWPGQIGVCEPRRVAAISLANRVADETGSLVQGDTVGYAVRFDACTNKPKIKVSTKYFSKSASKTNEKKSINFLS